MVSRREVLSTVLTGGVLSSAWSSFQGKSRAVPTDDTPASHKETGGRREERVQFVEAEPDQGFNFPYYLARPAEVRAGQVPLLVEMNNASDRETFEETKLNRAKGQITDIAFQGAWLSEELGVPHLKPVVPQPDNDTVDRTHKTINLNRNAMLLEGTKYDRIDLQVLSMADHARQELLSDLPMHDKVLCYGNSSEGRFAVRFGILHPEEIIAIAAGGINGFVTLPLAELGGHTLKYPVGIADLEQIIGNPYDPEAHDAVDKFYFLGGADEKNPLPMTNGLRSDEWNDEEVYESARAVYGSDMQTDRFPRCQIAYHMAGIDAQFRLVEGMGHDPDPASHELLEFYRTSLAGGDVSSFGQRLELPLNRDIGIGAFEPEVGDSIPFSVGGDYPPPEGLVNYTWDFGDGTTGSGLRVSHSYEDTGTYDVTLSMKTAHGQHATTTTQLAIKGMVGITNASISPTEVPTGDPVSITVELANQAADAETIELVLKEDQYPNARLNDTEVTLENGVTRELTIIHVFDEPGEYPLQLNGESIGNVTVVEATPTPSPTPSPKSTPTQTSTPTKTEAQTPGLGIISSLAGLGSAVGYLIARDRDQSEE